MIPDCKSCVAADCERKQEGTFCPSYREREAPEYDENLEPNVRWSRGWPSPFGS